MGLDDLADLLAANRTPLAAAATLTIVETLPDMSLSTAKVSLGRIGALDGAPPPLTFLASVKHASQRSALILNLDYVVNELEYAIRDVPLAGTYQASSWLTFVRPFDPAGGGADGVVDTAIAQLQVPIPLRAYPPAPMLTGQSGVASHSDAAAFPDVREWDYRYDFDVQSAAQDADHLRAVFGEAGAANTLAASAGFTGSSRRSRRSSPRTRCSRTTSHACRRSRSARRTPSPRTRCRRCRTLLRTSPARSRAPRRSPARRPPVPPTHTRTG